MSPTSLKELNTTTVDPLRPSYVANKRIKLTTVDPLLPQMLLTREHNNSRPSLRPANVANKRT